MQSSVLFFLPGGCNCAKKKVHSVKHHNHIGRNRGRKEKTSYHAGWAAFLKQTWSLPSLLFREEMANNCHDWFDNMNQCSIVAMSTILCRFTQQKVPMRSMGLKLRKVCRRLHYKTDVTKLWPMGWIQHPRASVPVWMGHPVPLGVLPVGVCAPYLKVVTGWKPQGLNNC